MEDLKAFHGCIPCSLDYNQLKRLLLRTIAESGPTDSVALVQKLSSVGERFEIHAVRMALVRYYRQGLLKRERAGGQFKYSLSSRGTARLRWLEGQTTRSESS
jgi:DNA-binding transcriptional regulator PaaX